MRFIAGLVALAGLAGLVALFAPLDGGSLLIEALKGDGKTMIQGIVLLAAAVLGLVLGGFAVTKERMSRLHSTATLIGFAAAAVIVKIWVIVKALTQGVPLAGTILILTGSIVLGVIASLAAMIKGRATY